METLIFIILAVIATGSAVSILVQRHPIYSALSLILTFIALAGIYIQMHAEFIAVMQIVVYTGAIMVLFVFVIMLLNVREESVSQPLPPPDQVLWFTLIDSFDDSDFFDRV